MDSGWKSSTTRPGNRPGIPSGDGFAGRMPCTSMGGGAGRPGLAWPLPAPELNNNAAVPHPVVLTKSRRSISKLPIGRLPPETNISQGPSKEVHAIALHLTPHPWGLARTARENDSPVRLQLYHNRFLAGGRARRGPQPPMHLSARSVFGTGGLDAAANAGNWRLGWERDRNSTTHI